MPHYATLTCSLTIPLDKIHRHVVDVFTTYPYHSVDSIDTWYLVWNMMLVLHLVSPGPLASVSFYRFIVSLSFYRYRYRYTEIVSVRVFFSYRLVTILPKLSVRHPPQTFISSVFSTPFPQFSCPLYGLSLYSFCSDHTIHMQTGVHSSILSGEGNDTHQTTSQAGPTAVAAEGPFHPLFTLLFISSIFCLHRTLNWSWTQ